MPGNGHACAMAAADKFAGTGAPCPASGWWRCEDTDALDGTRWFAHGELLPPATFQIPGTRFSASASASTDIFRRRSRWQLVRPAPGHGSQPAAS
jgi:hypothetical protein